MIEKGKSVLLVVLVAASLVQSYFLAYSMPNMEAKVRTELDYVQTEPLGNEETVENLIFPEMMIVHLGEDQHTVFYPSTTTYYELILQKLKGREFNGLTRTPIGTVNWNEIRANNAGLELRFSRAVPFVLLARLLKIDSDFPFMSDSVDRIWVYAGNSQNDVHTYFFSADGRNVYEALRADITISDVQGYVGFGQYWDPYTTVDGTYYLPLKPIVRYLQFEVGYTEYTTQQMQENLFVDPGITRSYQNLQDGPQFFTDGKRGLKVEQDGSWMSYTDTIAPTGGVSDMVDNVMAAIRFINLHGGWNGRHMLERELASDPDGTIRFRQMFRNVPIVSGAAFQFGYMRLTMQQEDVSLYNRSLVNIEPAILERSGRQLPPDALLRAIIGNLETGGRRVEALFPAYRPDLGADRLKLTPVWAVRMNSGEVVSIAESTPN